MKKTWAEIIKEHKSFGMFIKDLTLSYYDPEDYCGYPVLCHPTIKSLQEVQAALRKGFDQFIGVDYGKDICQKCGCKDEYASPCAKHNNEIRCYKCCE